MHYERLLFLAFLFPVMVACEATIPTQPVDSAVPTGNGVVVEAEGIAHLGDEDRLSDAKKRAWSDAVNRSVAKGTAIHVEARSRSDFGVLTEDSARQAVAGSLFDVAALDEGLEGNRYRVRIRGKVRPDNVHGLITQQASSRRLGEQEKKRPENIIRSSLADSTGTHVVATEAAQETTVCCRKFPDRMLAEIYSALMLAPGVSTVRRLDRGSGRVCFRIDYTGTPEELSEWLRREIPSGSYRPFRIVRQEELKTLELVFDAGFD